MHCFLAIHACMHCPAVPAVQTPAWWATCWWSGSLGHTSGRWMGLMFDGSRHFLLSLAGLPAQLSVALCSLLPTERTRGSVLPMCMLAPLTNHAFFPPAARSPKRSMGGWEGPPWGSAWQRSCGRSGGSTLASSQWAAAAPRGAGAIWRWRRSCSGSSRSWRLQRRGRGRLAREGRASSLMWQW